MEDDPIWPRRIIFSNEKLFRLIQPSNPKNDVHWAGENPHYTEEVKKQGGLSVMCWVGIVDGKILPVHWFEGSVNKDSYLAMLEDKVWPVVRGSASRKGFWFQQDGARAHTAKACLDFLQQKFPGRVISDRLEFEWPPFSPNLNILDYWFWNEAERAVLKKKPSTLDDLKIVVEDVARNMSEDVIYRVADHFALRCKMCVESRGGHFEHLLK